MSVLWKKSFFSIFSCPHRKKIQKILIRPILTFDALPIAHFEAYVPNFSKHLWKLAISSKIWVSDPPKVGWSEFVSLKKAVFWPLFWRKSLFWPISTPFTPPQWYTSLESYGSQLSDRLAPNQKNEPVGRQIFGNASAEAYIHDLRVRLKKCFWWIIIYNIPFHT